MNVDPVRLRHGAAHREGFGRHCENDIAAIEQAGVLAMEVSLDKPAVDPTRQSPKSRSRPDRHWGGAGMGPAMARI
jgi:hypothetical protein